MRCQKSPPVEAAKPTKIRRIMPPDEKQARRFLHDWKQTGVLPDPSWCYAKPGDSPVTRRIKDTLRWVWQEKYREYSRYSESSESKSGKAKPVRLASPRLKPARTRARARGRRSPSTRRTKTAAATSSGSSDPALAPLLRKLRTGLWGAVSRKGSRGPVTGLPAAIDAKGRVIS